MSLSKQRKPEALRLNVALTYRHVRIALGKHMKGMKAKSNPEITRQLNAIKTITGVQDFRNYDVAKVQKFILNEWRPKAGKQNTREFIQQNKLAELIHGLQKSAVQSTTSVEFNHDEIYLNEEDKIFLFPYYNIKCVLEDGVYLSGSSTQRKLDGWKEYAGTGVWVLDQGGVQLCVGRHLICINVVNVGTYLASRDHLLMLADLASDRYVSLCLSVVDSKRPQPEFLSPRLYLELIDWGDEILRRLGNDGYKLIYKLEPLCTSKLVGDIPVGTPDGLTFRQWLLKDLSKYNDNPEVPGALKRILALIDKAFDINPQLVIQIFGMFRIWGHPTVEPLNGMIKLRDVSTRPRPLDKIKTDQLTCFFKETFIRRYIDAEGHWPDLDVSKLSETNVIRRAYENQAPYPKGTRSYKRGHLLLVDFKKTFAVDPKFELSELLDDKAGCLPLDELIASVLVKNSVGDSISRSVLVRWMNMLDHDPEEFLKKIDDQGFDPNESVTGAKGKEKEGKLDPRMFSLLCIGKRMYIVLTEALLSQHLLRYFPEITMNDDGITLDVRRIKTARPISGKVKLHTSMDFTKWNTNMREEETLPLFRCFDQLFGFTNLYARTHELFKTGQIMLMDGTYLPTIIDGKIQEDVGTIFHHLGGMEGLRQKGWTIWTVVLLLLCAEGLPISISLMGQGDNQVLCEQYPAGMTLHSCLNYHYQLLKRIEDFLSTIGPPLKPEETYSSADFFIYGKFSIYKGAACPLSGKKWTKICRRNNEEYPTLESTISSASATLSSAVESSNSGDIFFYLYLRELIAIFQSGIRTNYTKSINLKESVKKSPRFPVSDGKNTIWVNMLTKSVNPVLIKSVPTDMLLLRLCLMPRILGGYPIMIYPQICIRKFPDELSEAVSFLKLIHEVSGSDTVQKVVTTLLSPKLTTIPNYQLILEHPTSLSLLHPTSPADCRRNAAVEFLSRYEDIRNPALKEFLTVATSQGKTELLIEILSQCRPFSPRILGDLYNSTTEARARSIIGRLQRTSTIAELMRREGIEQLSDMVSKAEVNHFKGVLDALYTTGNYLWNPSWCSVKWSEYLREVGWKVKITGVSAAPPWEICHMDYHNLVDDCDIPPDQDPEGYILFRLDPSLSELDLQSVAKIGKFPPYRGSVTKDKIDSVGKTFARHVDSMLNKPLRVLGQVGWTILPGGNLYNLATGILLHMTDIDPSLLHPDEDQISGSVHHRYQDARSSHGGAATTLFTQSTKIAMDTSTLINHCKGGTNVNLYFQGMMCWGNYVLGSAMTDRKIIPGGVYHLHLKRSCCIQGVDETLIELPFPALNIPAYMTVNEKSPYLYKSSKHLFTSLLQRHLRIPRAPKPHSDVEMITRRAHVVAHECMRMLRTMDLEGHNDVSSGSSVTINWMFGLDGGTFIRSLCLKLASWLSLSHTVIYGREEFLRKIISLLSLSPNHLWRRLENLMFMTRVLTQATTHPWTTKLPGNPQLDPEDASALIKSWILNVYATWSRGDDPLLSSTECYSRPCGSVDQHPAHIIAIRDFLSGQLSGEIAHSKMLAIRKSLRSEATLEPIFIPSRDDLNLLVSGDQFLTGQTADFLSKKAPPYRPPPMPTITYESEFIEGQALIVGEFAQNCDRISSVLAVPMLEGTESSTTGVVHALKTANLPTTAAYKILDIIHSIYLTEKPVRRVFCSGDGSGGYSLVFGMLYPQAEIIFNTLLEPKPNVQQLSPIVQLPSLAAYPTIENRVVGLDLVNYGLSDLTHPRYPEVFGKRFPGQVDVVVCDAEGGGWEDSGKAIAITQTLTSIARSHGAHTLICKSYCSNPSTIHSQLIIMSDGFSRLRVLRTPYSTKGNTEVFLVGDQPHENEPMATVVECSESIYRVSGYAIALEEKDTMAQLLRERLDNHVIPTLENAHLLTNILHRFNDPQKAATSMKEAIPLVVPGGRIIFPQEYIKSVRSVHAHKSSKESDILGRGILGKLPRELMSKISIQWLALWGACRFQAGYEPPIETVVSQGSFLSYTTLSNEWAFSLTSQPLLSRFPGVLEIPLNKLIRAHQMKLIYKFIGLICTVSCQVTNCTQYQALPEVGGLTIKGFPIPRSARAKDPLIQERVQHLKPKVEFKDPPENAVFKPSPPPKQEPTQLPSWYLSTIHQKLEDPFYEDR